MKERIAAEISWLITIVFAIVMYWAVAEFAVWLNPDIRVAANRIWLVGSGALFALWVMGVFARNDIIKARK